MQINMLVIFPVIITDVLVVLADTHNQVKHKTHSHIRLYYVDYKTFCEVYLTFTVSTDGLYNKDKKGSVY